mgnify:CR=1 FL=1
MSKTKSLFGLSEMEAAVYRAALELGEGTMQDLARKSGVKRTSIYNFIERLKVEGYISMIRRKKRTLYSAVHPKHLVEIQKQRLGQFEQTLPELTAIYNKSAKKPRVTFYEGVEGIKEVYADTLREQRPIVAWSDFDYLFAALGDEYCEWYPTERAKRHIPFQTIARDSTVGRKIASVNEKYLRKTKFIKSGELKTEINIYGDKVAMMSLRSNPPYAILIENHDIAETLRTAWQELWSRLN